MLQVCACMQKLNSVKTGLKSKFGVTEGGAQCMHAGARAYGTPFVTKLEVAYGHHVSLHGHHVKLTRSPCKLTWLPCKVVIYVVTM